ncbi:hypothetical protein GGTG_11790 [Gaeumannomyces tritici R3-111a-1]|uniref:Uncharacterized protein n=1 Tax=Gaeumannomyces tritici (strain R3-111a-1) TaxID=644352 RepID=J3PE67_GAET3|nr:hypothetical protein GGTG_11790 [Gaeumannomyces tritici R3-111a-1]EJT70767.1 hypothetical protein GGTG_11790 [Gaeumannomyces tritici R3-111a-1]
MPPLLVSTRILLSSAHVLHVWALGRAVLENETDGSAEIARPQRACHYMGQITGLPPVEALVSRASGDPFPFSLGATPPYVLSTLCGAVLAVKGGRPICDVTRHAQHTGRESLGAVAP